MPTDRLHPPTAAVLALLLAGSSVAQPPRITFEPIEADLDRRSRPVRCVLQDQQGFVWIGARSGLWRYDGADRLGVPLPKHPASIRPSDVVSSLAPAADGGLWVGTVHGLAHVDRNARRAVARGPRPSRPRDILRTSVHDLCVDRRGRVWIATGGLVRFDPAQDRSEDLHAMEAFRVLAGNPATRVDIVRHVESGSNGEVWILRRSGHLSRVDPATDRVDTVEWQATLPAAAPGESSSLTVIDDEVWIGSSRGLFRYQVAGDACEEIRDGDTPFAGRRTVTAVARGDDGRVWVGTNGAGIFMREAPGRAWNHYRHDRTDGNSLIHDRVNSLDVDRSGVLWVSTPKGLVRADARRRFRYYTIDDETGASGGRAVYDIHKSEDGTLWFGNGRRGLRRIDPDGKQTLYAPDPEDPKRLRNGRIQAIEPAASGRLWLGTREGLHLFDGEAGVIQHFTHEPGSPSSLRSPSIRAVHAMAGAVLVGTARGVDRLDPATGAARPIELRGPASAHANAGVVLDGIYEGQQGELWILLVGGAILRVDPETTTATTLDLGQGGPPDDRFRAIVGLLDTGPRLLLATVNGLYECRRDGSGLRKLTIEADVRSPSSSTVLSGDDGRLWVGTPFDGLLLLDREGGARRFGMRDGVAGDSVYGCGAQRAADGEFLFSSGPGLLRFYEEDVLREPPPPKVVLTQLSVHGQERKMELGADHRAELSPTDNFFSFRFAVLDFLDPSRNRCFYKLEGFDPDWVACGSKRSIRYTNVDAGVYTFRVKAVNSSGVASVSEATFAIRVLPPFWRTWWFRVAVALAIALLLGGYLAYARALADKGLRLQEEYEERTRAEEQARQLETRLLQAQKMEALGRLAGGIAHDFNNILTSILGYADLATRVAGQDPSPETVTRSLSEIRHGAERAADLTRQLLAFSRNEVIRPTPLDLSEVVAGIEPMIRRVVRENIELAIDLEPDLPPILADEGQVGQVILNLVVNASDAMPHGGQVGLRSRRSTADGFVELAVTDSGHGMQSAELERIFDPFYTTKDVGEGTGLGLATVHGIVTKAGGTIEVESQPARGSTFVVRFPITEESRETPPLDPPTRPGGRETILVCEDDLAVLELAADLLRRHGYRVLACSRPREALATADACGLTLEGLVTDIVMPEMSGQDLATAIQESHPGIAIVYVSGYPANVANADGGFDYLEKPFTAGQLLSRLRHALDATQGTVTQRDSANG